MEPQGFGTVVGLGEPAVELDGSPGIAAMLLVRLHAVLLLCFRYAGQRS